MSNVKRKINIQISSELNMAIIAYKDKEVSKGRKINKSEATAEFFEKLFNENKQLKDKIAN
jgi:hypothetical protein